jgi:tetratricopeptide (TPR) repeat protein
MLYSARKNPLAVEYLNTAITLRPMALEPYYQLALFFQENSDVQKAIITYESILKIDPLHQFSLYNLGYINLVYLEDFVKGAEYFTQVIELNPQYTEAYYNRGYCYELSGKTDLARKDYQKTLEISANFQKAIEGLNRLD